ncbi:MAG: AAA family ATPase [Thaumarchaeota archaeon]|nr:AAA family ATPase [Nitrososphaerota archaeon]
MPNYISTGIPGVDELLEGRGIPEGHIVFLLGSPGSGKTTFALQMLYKGATEYNEPGVFITLDESPRRILDNASSFTWNLRELKDEGKILFIDASPIKGLKGLGTSQDKNIAIGKKDFSLDTLVDMIETSVKEIGAKRLVVDPLASLMLEYPKVVDRRKAILELMEAISRTNCTALLVSELAHASLERKYQIEEYLAQGVMVLQRVVRSEGLNRIFQVEKMRGINHDSELHPYKINKDGINIFARERIV